MFTLLRGLWKYFFRKDEYYVLILGLDNAGKTTFLEQTKSLFINNYDGMPLNKITSTVGLNVARIEQGSTRLIFWDLGGQEDLQSLWDKYYAECQGVIYVVDSSDPENLAMSSQTFRKVILHPDLEGAPLLILANKQDRQDALPLTEVESAFNTGVESIGDRDCKIQRVSALKGEGVTEGIEWLTQRVQQSRRAQMKSNSQ
ncbi:ADP-ribosylation factor-related protein 1-like [Halichondria panicea]|uniref:ADP-ribosylation factor-related protein 1-like n=1 Tax=Halichondria panicea TaxID=6063 RepID=UPI00312B3F14